MSPITDNIAITPGVGASVATDDIGGVQWQRVKIGHGVDGEAVDASATDPLPVTAPAASRSTHSIAVAVQTDAIMNDLNPLTPKFFSATVTAPSTDTSLISAVTGKKLRILALVVQCAGTATTVLFESGTSTRIHRVPAGANGGQVLGFNPVGWFETAASAALTCSPGTGSDVDVSGVYIEV